MIARLAQTLTTPELRRLISRLLPRPILAASFIWDWLLWRREHQVNAAIAHRKISTKTQL